MKKLLVILLFTILLSSCASTYYYSTISTNDNQMLKMQNGDFLAEDDTISILYSFNGYDVPIWISVYNKLDKPLLIDWKKSFLIIDDLATSYSKSGGSFEGFSRSYGSTYHTSSGWSFSESSGITRGNIDLPDDVAFIPPRTKVEYEGMRIENIDYKKMLAAEDYDQAYINDKRNQPKSVQSVDFEIDNSPLRFRSYLTLYPENAPEKAFIYDQAFFISNVIKTKSKPESLSPRFSKRGDITFKIEPFQMNAMHYTAATVGVVGSVALFWILFEPDMDTSIDPHPHPSPPSWW